MSCDPSTITGAVLPEEEVFDLGDLFPIPDGFDKIHKNPVNIDPVWLDYVHQEHLSKIGSK